MVLVDILHQKNLPISVLHCNFQLRGADSDEDEAFVKMYCENRDIPLEIKRFNTLAYRKNEKQSIQEIARNLRYDWFDEILAQDERALLCTAHHADDQEEQIWLRLLSSGRLLDLGGIPKQRGQYRRPLLSVAKAEILNYAENRRLHWQEDVSNLKTDYTRNKIRLNLTPLLRDLDPRYPQALQRLHSEIQLLKAQSSAILKNHFGDSLSKGEFFVSAEFWENQLFIIKEMLLEEWSKSSAGLGEIERFVQQAQIGSCLDLKNEFYVLKEKDGLWFGNSQLDYFEEVTIQFKSQENTKYSSLQAFVSQILGKENWGNFENKLLRIQRIPVGEHVHFINGKKRPVKKVFNDRSWSQSTRRKALGIYHNDRLIDVFERARLESNETDKNHFET